ncbi:uncharacterized protein LOC143555428 [Bidens hawaiensis]|uniref:uncharacterized protein LOC143555428 n=1 Tax=Bidens hawaiensis TaxID=980011 RepID=UPI00404B769E
MATVTLFDEAVFSLVRTDAMKMVIEKAFEDPETIPDPLQVKIGQTKMFQLQFNNRIDQGSTRFTCNKVLENPNVLQQVPHQKPPSTELQQSLLQENTSKDKTIIADQTHTVAPPYPKSTSPATNISTPPPTTPAPIATPKRHATVDTSEVVGPIPAKRQLHFGNQCKQVESPKKDNHPRNSA